MGISIPTAFEMLKPPVSIEWHQKHFEQWEQGVDSWLATVGGWQWIVVSEDHKFHRREHELTALKQYGVGCFYMWGQNAKPWDVVQVLVPVFDRMIELAESTPRPFLYRIGKDRVIRPLALP